MRELLALLIVGLFALVGCSKNNEQPPPAPQTSDVTIHVSDTNGVAAPGITVVATQKISDSQNEQIAEGTTDTNGNTSLTLPENITASIGLWKNQDESEAVYTWQTPFIVPIDDTTLSYSYVIADATCTVVQPGPTPCPTPAATPMPSSTVNSME